MGRRGRAAVAVLALVLVLAGCSSSHPRFSPDLTEIINTNSAFRATTLQDWKDLGDAIVAAQITDERPDPGTGTQPPGANGTYNRLVDVQIVQVYWQRGASFAPPTRFTMTAWGHVLRGNQQQPIVGRGEPRLEKDHVYVLVVAKFPTGWSALGTGAEVPFDNGTVGVGEWEGRDKSMKQPAIDSLLGDNAAQLQAAINATQPDPRAAKYDDLSPAERAAKLGIGS